jgi:type IV pilus assembly protein PilY1
MRRSLALLALLAAVVVCVALLVRPNPVVSQTTPLEKAASNLLAASYVDAILNPARGEDTEFFINRGGVPNIMFLLDTSPSMLRVPPNGPPSYATTLLPEGVEGCGLEAPSSVDATFMGSGILEEMNSRRFNTACGDAAGGAAVHGQRYLGHPVDVAGGIDYAAQASVCPYYTESDAFATGAPGFDPDYYSAAADTFKQGSTPNFFKAGAVFHDSMGVGPTWARSDTATTSVRGDGWRYDTVYPFLLPSGAIATIDGFCQDKHSNDTSGNKAPVCKKCLKEKGWYYDGEHVTRDVDGQPVTAPSIWYSGNYLNFFPPKFLTVRKVVKDIIASQSKVRMGLAVLDADGMKLEKAFNPTCDHPDSSFDSNRSTYVKQLNTATLNPTATSKRLATALFDVGRFYHSPGLEWFGGTFETGEKSADTASQFAICYSCQTSSVIVLSDGYPTSDDTALPVGAASKADSNSGKYGGDDSTGILPSIDTTGTVSGGVSTTDCPECRLFTPGGTEDYRNNLARVAWYLHNYDLRDDTEGTRDCKMNGGKQTLDVYTVGFRTASNAVASRILAATAKAGGGIFVQADEASLLRSNIIGVFDEISSRSTSFSVATVSTLQTSSGHSVIVPRFDPEQASSWKGHLYRYELYSEFVNTCTGEADATCCTPDGPGDLDCDGACASVFLTDSGNRFIQEGGDGFFYRNSPNLAACTQSTCGTCGDVGNAPAQPWWDAADALRETSWKSRKVFTVVDANDDGTIDRTDTTLSSGVIDLYSALTNDTLLDAFLPYVGVGSDGGVCSRIASKIEESSNLESLTGTNAAQYAQRVRTVPRSCARMVIRYVLGADVFNERDSTTDWPSSANDLPDRPHKLGDVFHSSPVVVDPPPPADGILCPNGLHNQCLNALWQTPTKHEGANAYQDYATSTEYKNRRKVILVGANDGLLHAFNGGTWHPNDNDDETDGIDESKWPFNGYYDRSFDPDGSPTQLRAEELWAFLPPDLISKVPLMMTGQHQLFVDGTSMVRDIWVDGTSNGIAGSGTLDDTKQKQEFHTVAVVGERRGGTRYFALDVGDATKKPGESGFAYPKFLWMYPQPDDRTSLEMGETYTDFLPVAPPIGPVRIRGDANAQSALGVSTPKTWTLTMTVPGEADPVPYHERWVAMLSGGYDPQYLRARGVHMVDVWTGKEIFDFSYPRNPASAATDDPRLALRYPIPATVGMVAWGATVAREDKLAFGNKGFFDTATFGDTGGQLWVLRFHEPATVDTEGKATNWHGARVFEMGDGTNPSLKSGYPFFYITANTAVPGTYTYRVFAGTGDRFNLLDKMGGQCGPDNVRACVQRGCSVTLDEASNKLSATSLGTLSRSLSQGTSGDFTTGGSADPTAASIIVGRARIAISCPTATTALDYVEKDVGVTCVKDQTVGGNFNGYWSCNPGLNNYGLPIPTADNITARNWYFSLRVFDEERPPFRDAAGAKTYDSRRLWLKDGSTVTKSDATLVVIDGGSDTQPAVLAGKTDAGWALYYNHEGAITTDGHVYTVKKVDERTSSVNALFRILTWNSTQPTLSVEAEGTCDKSKCMGEERRLAYHYGADPVTGGLALRNRDGELVRSLKGNTLVPAQGDQPTVFVNQKGQIAVGLTVINPEKGATNVGQTNAVDPVRDVGFLEVSDDMHACRHATAQPDNAVCQ